MKQIITLITVVWAITQLPTKDLAKLKQGEKVKVKNKVAQVWAMPTKNILIIEEVRND